MLQSHAQQAQHRQLNSGHALWVLILTLGSNQKCSACRVLKRLNCSLGQHERSSIARARLDFVLIWALVQRESAPSTRSSTLSTSATLLSTLKIVLALVLFLCIERAEHFDQKCLPLWSSTLSTSATLLCTVKIVLALVLFHA